MNRSVVPICLIAVSILLFVAQPHAGERVDVRWVDDGDTIVLKDGRRVRYIGVNTPEIAHADQKAEPFGYEAKYFNKELVFPKRVRLEFDKQRYDRYGRLLAYVFLADGTFVNAKLIEAGYGFYLYREPNVRYGKRLIACQRKAMSASKGIWRGWREEKGVYIGNRRSRRFHRISCTFGQKTPKKNRRFFSMEWEAFWAGYAPCKRCNKGIRNSD